MSEPFRLRCVLGKFPVVEVTATHFKLQLAGTTTAIIDRPPMSDVRSGDLLTLYTEVLLSKPQGTS